MYWGIPYMHWVILRLLTPRPNRAVVTTLPRPNCQTATATADSMHVTGPFTLRPTSRIFTRKGDSSSRGKGDTWRHYRHWHKSWERQAEAARHFAGFQAMGSSALAQCHRRFRTHIGHVTGDICSWRGIGGFFFGVLKDTGSSLAMQNMATWCFKDAFRMNRTSHAKNNWGISDHRFSQSISLLMPHWAAP